jgi:hypothetical protein
MTVRASRVPGRCSTMVSGGIDLDRSLVVPQNMNVVRIRAVTHGDGTLLFQRLRSAFTHTRSRACNESIDKPFLKRTLLVH